MKSTTKPYVLLTDPLLPQIVTRDLKPFAKIRVVKNSQELYAEISKADALITLLSTKITDVLLSRATRLKVVGNFAVGLDNIDLKACALHGVRVVNTPGVLTRSTAELTLALLLAAARRIPEGEKNCRKGKFSGWSPLMLLGQELKGRKAVLVGKGRIGKETAKLFHAIGIQVEWITHQDSDSEISAKLKAAQILSLHFPLTKETHHWLNASRIKLLPNDCIVLNTSRGATIDEKALIRALKSRKIFSAGLDVYEHEPRIPKSLCTLPNVVLLPHLGSATEEAREAMARLVIRGVLGILSGKRPANEVKFRGAP